MDQQEFQEKVMGYLVQFAEDMTALRQDMTARRQELKTDIAALRAEMNVEIAGLREAMTLEVSRLRQDVTAEIGGLREEVTMKMTSLRQEITSLRQGVQELDGRVKKIELQIENEISPKTTVLLDGYTQQTAQLKRIEEKVSRHEEFIITRVK